MNGRVPGTVIRERGRRVREVSAGLTARFRNSQIGSVRSGLTIEDGTLVVTDNYLKVRIPSGLARNRAVKVELTSASGADLYGSVVAVS